MTQTQTRSRTPLIVGAVGAAVVGLLIVAVLFGGNAGSPQVPVEEELGSPTIEGSLPAMPNVRADETATGLPAPNLTGADFAGGTVAIENDGRAKAIVFLSHSCPHCQAEVPRVQEWLDSGGGVDGVDLYSVATNINPLLSNYPASAWLDGEGWTVPVIRDDAEGSAHRAYGNGGFPFWVFVNSDGTVALRVAGETSIADLEQILEGLG